MTEEVYKVVGGLQVAGVQPGETVSRSKLFEYDPNVNLDALIMGGHLEQVKGGSQTKTETKKAGEA